MSVIVKSPWGEEDTARIKCLACGTDRESLLRLTAAVRKFKDEHLEDDDAAEKLFRELIEIFAQGYL